MSDNPRHFDRLVIAMQAAWIEWKHGDGSESAMEWIENTLDGPDLIPRGDFLKLTAQEYFDQMVARIAGGDPLTPDLSEED